MTAKNRATQIGKLHTALKKHFKPAPPSPGRPLMEHVLYASLLEDTPADLADEGFAKCEQEFFDWNEVRVTTVTELAEVLSRLPSPTAAAIRLKKNLQSMFETFYNFDIDYLKKENLGKAVAKFEAMSGMTPFVLSYLVQHGLGGHAIPIDRSAMKVIWLSGIVTEAESESGKVPGLERTIAKNRAIEFSSLLHQAGIAFQANPKDKNVWDVLLSVNKDAKTLFDRPPVAAPVTKKTSKAAPPSKPVTGKLAAAKPGTAAKPAKLVAGKPVPAVAEKKPTKTESATKTVETGKSVDKSKSKDPAEQQKPVKAAATKPIAAKPSTSKPAGSKSLPAESKPVSEKKSGATEEKPASSKTPTAKKPVASKQPAAKTPAVKPSSGRSETKPTAKKPASEKLKPATKDAASTNKHLTKQKPR